MRKEGGAAVKQGMKGKRKTRLMKNKEQREEGRARRREIMRNKTERRRRENTEGETAEEDKA